VTLIADPLFYLLAVPAVITLGLSKGGFAGVGQMAVPMLALAIPPLEGAAILLPIMIVQDVISVWVYRKDFSGRILAIMIPAASEICAAVRTFTGAATLAFVLYSWLGPKRLAADVGAASVPAGIVWGMLSGFASTVASAGAPPYQMYVLPQKLKKMTYVGTTAIMFATVNWMKIIPYVALGQFSTAGLGTSLALLPLAIATNLLGFWLVRVTPTAIFYKVTLIIMFFISIELTREGLGEMLRG
jgi:uncharacterized membrane protein YfcA